MTRTILALTLGDPAGIGPEITARTLADTASDESAHRVAIGDAEALRRAVEICGLSVRVREVADFQAGSAGAGIIDVLDTGVLGKDLPPFGKVDARAGRAAVAAIELATRAALAREVTAIVTAPINKESLWASGSKHLGHTEMLAELTGAENENTMFVIHRTAKPGHELKIFFTTRHTSLRAALDGITREAVLHSITQAITALRVFGVREPRLAVAAVNPHGGENGAFGDEEIEHIAPACEEARFLGLDVVGPVPADSVFHQGLAGRYDGILSHYHDQGHIAAKTYDFDGTVSVTVGLPILRTSVDHGTAFDIAGSGVANHATMAAACHTAFEYSAFVSDIRRAYGRITGGNGACAEEGGSQGETRAQTAVDSQ